jgi:hypothetical protein
MCSSPPERSCHCKDHYAMSGTCMPNCFPA